jgi:hypothetical protein
MTIRLTGKGDILTVTGVVTDLGYKVTVVDTSLLNKGSWTSAVFTHPGPFKPSPQNLTAAQTASGAGSKLKYLVLGGTTVLGITGTASSGSAANPILPNDDID